jgi:hypothetical protein
MKFKNNKISDYKSKVLNCILNPYIEFLNKETLDDRLTALNQISSIQELYPLIDRKLNIKCEFDKMFDEIINEKNLRPQSIITILELINKSNCEKNEKSTKVTNLLNFIYETVSKELISNHRENKFNFPLVCILMKNLCSLEEKEFLPKHEHVKVFCDYVKKEIPFFNKKKMIIKESLYLLTLMNKIDFIDTEALEEIYLYTLPHIHLVDINEKSLQDYIHLIKTHDLENENKFKSILDNLENNILNLDFITPSFSLDCLLKSVLFSKYINNSGTSKKCFENFMNKINSIPSYDISKVSMNLFESVIKNYVHLPLEYKNPILEKLLDNILYNFEEISLFKYSTVKLYIFINQIKGYEILNGEIFKKAEKLNNLLCHEKNLNFFFKGLKILAESKAVKFNNSILKSISELIKNNSISDCKSKLPQNYQENTILFLYIILKNQKNNSNQILDLSIIQDILNTLANQNFIRSDLKFNLTVNILKTFTESKLNSPSLLRLFEAQINNKLITSKNTLNKQEILDLLSQLESITNSNYPSLNYIKAKLIY